MVDIRNSLYGGIDDARVIQQQGRANALNERVARNQFEREKQLQGLKDEQLAANDEQQGLRWVAGAADYVLNRPEALPEVVKYGQQKGYIDPNWDYTTLDPEELRSTISRLRDEAVGKLGGAQEPEVGKGDLVQIMGEDGTPRYTRAADAIGQQPVSNINDSKPPADVASYEYYRQQELSQGRQPVSFAEFRTKDIPKEGDKAQRIIAARSRINSIDNTIQNISDAMGLVNFWSTGTMGQLLERVGGTDAAKLKAQLEPIMANFAFDRLQEMRDASKTGGALGAISERELDLLAGAYESFKTAQGQEELIGALEKARNHYMNLRQLQVGQEALMRGVPFASTPDEARALGSGATFVDPNGKVRRVP